MKEKIGFFEEQQPNGVIAKSALRWGFLVMIVFSSVVTAYMVWKQQIDLGLIALLYGVTFGGKVGQKYMEGINPPNKPTE